jgi:tRNA nucleotidyltransferase (CCA-adding enzyme)
VDFNPPREVLRITRTLEKAGFEAWCVGGAVRDALLGHAHLDWDFATSAAPQQVRSLFPRTIPVGIDFGTVGVLDSDGVMHEVTTYRRDVQTDGRHAVVEFGASLDEDLARRDYTINAIAYSPTTKTLHDPFGGREDLERRMIRAVGEPTQRMQEDRLRALRAMRFAARFAFDIESATWAAITASAPHLPRLSAERVKQELEKTMDQVKAPSRAFALWRESGALGVLIPQLGGITDIQLSVLDHLRIPMLAGRAQRRLMRLTGLFAAANPREVAAMVKALRFSNADVSWISSIVTSWATLNGEIGFELASPAGPSDGVLRRWAAIAGRTRLAAVLRLADAYWWAQREAGQAAPSKAQIASAYRRAIRVGYRDPIELSDLALTGRDLEKLGIMGPAVGKTLRYLLEKVINDPAENQPARLTELAGEFHRSTRTDQI